MDVHGRRGDADEEGQNDEEVVEAKVGVCDENLGSDAEENRYAGDGAEDDGDVDKEARLVADWDLTVRGGHVFGSFPVSGARQ